MCTEYCDAYDCNHYSLSRREPCAGAADGPQSWLGKLLCAPRICTVPRRYYTSHPGVCPDCPQQAQYKTPQNMPASSKVRIARPAGPARNAHPQVNPPYYEVYRQAAIQQRNRTAGSNYAAHPGRVATQARAAVPTCSRSTQTNSGHLTQSHQSATQPSSQRRVALAARRGHQPRPLNTTQTIRRRAIPRGTLTNRAQRQQSISPLSDSGIRGKPEDVSPIETSSARPRRSSLPPPASRLSRPWEWDRYLRN